MRLQRAASPSGSKMRKSTMVMPNTPSLSGAKSCTNAGNCPESALVRMRSTSGRSVRTIARQREAEQRRRRHAGAVHAAGHRVPVGDHELDDEMGRERGHGEIEALEAQ